MVPVGNPGVEFNSHRVFDPKEMLTLFNDFNCKLIKFHLVDDNGNLNLDFDFRLATNYNFEAVYMFLKKSKIIIYLLLLILFLFSFLFGTYSMYKRVWPFRWWFYSWISWRRKFREDAYWANEIINGGYVLYVRHAEREKWNDIVTAYDAYELKNKIDARNSTFSRATCLTEKGVEDAKLLGEIFNHANIKISKIFSSPSCRSRETALNAFGKVDKYASYFACYCNQP